MSSNNRRVLFQRWVARRLMFGSFWIFKYSSYGFTKVITKFLICVAYPLVGRQKKIAKESLDIAFSDTKTDEEKKILIKKCFYSFALSMTEMLYYMTHADQVNNNVSFDGLEHLDASLKKGKGVIVLTAHYGNFPLMMLALAKKGYDVNTIIRPARDKEVAEFLCKKKKEQGIGAIYATPKHKCVHQSLQVLRRNGILFIPIDQNAGAGGVFVDFFGQQAATATGPVVFSQRTGADIILMFIRRGDNDQHMVTIQKPILVVEKESDKETLHFNMAKITKDIELFIRKYPHEWAWMHRRWKSRPSE